jgi:hypothetical protein
VRAASAGAMLLAVICPEWAKGKGQKKILEEIHAIHVNFLRQEKSFHDL